MIKPIVGSDGAPFWVPEIDNLVTAAIGPGSWWEPYLLPLFDACCRVDRWTLEVGAYVGDHTIALGQRGPVIAVEPQALPWALLGLNLATRTIPHPWLTAHALLYSHIVTFEAAPGWQDDHPSNGYQIGAGEHYSTTLDACARRLDTVGFLKCDAQGCDLRVLMGGEETVQRCRPIILCEFEPALAVLHGDTAEDYRIWFRQHMYAIRGFLGGNILAVPHEIAVEPYWRALTDQGIELTP